ncbi:MAG: AI-2E family transporter [Deltaproteobacteria bacterium]|nr:MAG: AI-2E family transporter [Deltaproteobacteria bacterium]
MRPPDKTQTFLLAVIAAVLVGAVLYSMRPVILPIVLAVFFALMVRPVHQRLRTVMPDAVSLTLVTLLVGLLLIAIPLMFAANIQAIVDKVPEYAPRIQSLIEDLRGMARDLHIDADAFSLSDKAAMDSLLSVLSASVQGAASFLGTVVLSLFIMIFVLTEADVVRPKLSLMLDRTEEDKVTQSVVSMRAMLTQYVATKTLIAALSGLSAGLFTWALGIDFPFVWGVLTFVLYYIPNFGAMIAMVPPVLLALIQFETPTRAIVALVSMIISFNLIGNVLEPRLLGKALSLSPFVVFISLLFWGWYLGFVGVILSVPLTVSLKVICEHIDVLRPLAIIMGDDPEDYRARGMTRDSATGPSSGDAPRD